MQPHHWPAGQTLPLDGPQAPPGAATPSSLRPPATVALPDSAAACEARGNRHARSGDTR
jgi:hypothetical protein